MTGPDGEVAVQTSGVYDPESGSFGPGTVVVDGETVTDVCREPPEGVNVVLETDGYALPGFVDAHSHCSIRPWEGDQMAQLAAHRTTATVKSVNNLRTDLAAGTTTLRSMGEEGYLDVRLAAAEREGEFDGPTVLASGVPLTPIDGHANAGTSTDGPVAVRERVRENMREGATHTKFMGTGGIISDTGPLRPQYSRAEIAALIDETHRHDNPVATHAYGGEGAIVAIEEGVDTIEHATRFGETELELVEGGDQFLVATSAVYFHERGIEAEARGDETLMEALEEVRGDFEASWRQILDADVNVAVGTDSLRGAMPFEIEKLIEFGATPQEAIAAATIDAARCARCAETVGSVEPGKRADLVIVDDDPRERTETLREPAAVFHRGTRVADRMNTTRHR